MFANLATGECVWDPPAGVKVVIFFFIILFFIVVAAVVVVAIVVIMIIMVITINIKVTGMITLVITR